MKLQTIFYVLLAASSTALAAPLNPRSGRAFIAITLLNVLPTLLTTIKGALQARDEANTDEGLYKKRMDADTAYGVYERGQVKERMDADAAYGVYEKRMDADAAYGVYE